MSDAVMDQTEGEDASSPGAALADIAVVFGVSALALAIELAAKSAGVFSFGESATGVLAVLAGAAAAIFVFFRRGMTFADLGFRRPKRYWTIPFWVVGILSAYIGAQLVAPAAVSALLGAELPAPDLSRFANVYQNLPLALLLAVGLPLTASIPEEVIYRGFLMNRLTVIFGAGALGAALTVAVQSLVFGAIHFQWGLGGMMVTAVMGAVWGTAFILCGRNLWIMIIAHSTGHLLMVVQLYLAGPAAA